MIEKTLAALTIAASTFISNPALAQDTLCVTVNESAQEALDLDGKLVLSYSDAGQIAAIKEFVGSKSGTSPSEFTFDLVEFWDFPASTKLLALAIYEKGCRLNISPFPKAELENFRSNIGEPR